MSCFKEKEFHARRNGLDIYCLAYIPENTQLAARDEAGALRFPTIIIGHGYGGSYQDNLNCAERYAKEGFASISFDFCGGTPFAKSQGRTEDMSVVTERDDMIAVFNAVLSQEFVDPGRIVLWGESMGGYVAALAAAAIAEANREAKQPDLPVPAALVLFYPAFNIRDEVHSSFGFYDAIKDQPRRDILLGKCFAQDIWDLDTWHEIPKYKGPVLILHGDSDDVVPIGYSEKTRNVYAARPAEEGSAPAAVTYKVTSGAGHGFFNETGAFADRIVTDFLKAVL
ncbi:MAG: alpha/beta fold hydrolase [Firmicutes bacterium]|nr:alpha/beta fold hydrolase [Bacillota bacterium]